MGVLSRPRGGPVCPPWAAGKPCSPSWERRLLHRVKGHLSKETTMRFRTLFLFLLLVATGWVALMNWPAFTTTTTLSLGFGTIEAPLGLLMLGVVFVLGAMCLAQIIYVQGTALVDSRRQAKELQAQR